MHPRSFILVATALLSVSVLAQGPEFPEPALPRPAQGTVGALAQLADGTSYRAATIRWEKHVVALQGASDVRELRLDDLVVWGHPRDVRREPYLLLDDGSVLAGEVTSISAEYVEFASRRRPGLWQKNRLARSSVRGIVSQASADPMERDRWEAEFFAPAARGGQDRLLLVGGDVLIGTLLQSTPAEGDAEEKAGSAFRLQLPGNKTPLEVPQYRVTALAFAANAPATANAGRAWLGLADGSTVLVQSIARDADRVVVTLADGQTLQAAAADDDVEPPESFWSRVVFLQPVAPSVVYLSDLRTLGFKHVPLLDWEQPFAADRSVVGTQLRAGGQRYLKGIGMPATSRLAYEIPAGAKRFEAEVAIDDAAEGAGSVTFRVFLEAEGGKWNAVAETKLVRGGDAPAPLRVPLGNARRLALVVDMADHGDTRDYADWLNARFLK